MFDVIRRVFSKQNRALLAELVRTDFKLRYQGSVLGYAWSLLRPLLLFVILYLVFVRFLKVGDNISHYPVYLLFGIVLWNFFNEMTVRSLTSIVDRGDLLRKIKIPRWMIILSTSISAFINFFLNLLVVVVFMIFNHVEVTKTMLWLPLILLEIYILALGLSMFLAAAFVKYRDVSYIWEVIMQAGFYFTPIIYPLSRLKNPLFLKLISFNPMAQAVQDARYSTITHQTLTIYQIFKDSWLMFIPFLIIIAVFFVGLVYFRSESKFFAENV